MSNFWLFVSVPVLSSCLHAVRVKKIATLTGNIVGYQYLAVVLSLCVRILDSFLLCLFPVDPSSVLFRRNLMISEQNRAENNGKILPTRLANP